MRSTTRLYSRLLLALLAAASLLPPRLFAEDITKQYVGEYALEWSVFALEFFTGQKVDVNLLLEGSVQTGSGSNTAVHACTSQITPTPSKAVAATLTNVPGFPGQSQIQAANAAGVAVGTAQNGSSEDAPYLAFVATPPTGFVPASIIPATSTSWKITFLDNLANTTFSEALGINATGVSVGSDNTNSSQNAVMWSADGSVTNLNDVDGNSSLTLIQANAINDSGQIVGQDQDVTRFSAFLLDHGAATDLGSLGGGGSQAYGINNSGQIVGQSNTADFQTHAFLYTNGNMTDLGTLPGGNFSQANAINPSGLVIGISNLANGTRHAVAWDTNGTIHDLNAIAPNSTFVYTDATAIDSQGDIFVQAENSAKAQYGVLLVVASNSTSGSAPTIQTNPGNLTEPVGAMAMFTGSANGSPTPTYQWYFGTKKIAGATSSTYTIAKVATTNAGNYSFVATNSLGSATSKSATLTVLTPPKITGQLKPQTAASGGNATFSLTATGSPVLHFYWQFSKTTSGYGNLTMTTVSSLTLTGVTSSNQGNYRVIVSNAAGATSPSSAAKLTVKP